MLSNFPHVVCCYHLLLAQDMMLKCLASFPTVDVKFTSGSLLIINIRKVLSIRFSKRGL